MINEGSDATAIEAVNDMVAAGCAEVLLSQKLKIPDDVSITGFGNSLLSEHFRVPLTTIDQPKHRLGAAAMDVMVQLLRGSRPESKRIPAPLVVRASSGRIPAASMAERLKKLKT
jgi:LacI family transcriptional regulator